MRIKCDNCDLARINGVICHETGCPNSKARYEDGTWVCMVDADQTCCSGDDDFIADQEEDYEEDAE